jgi:hypothetical protein
MKIIKALFILAAVSLWVSSSAAKDESSKTEKSRRPNILLVIADDIGMDVMSNIYPGMIENLVDRKSVV